MYGKKIAISLFTLSLLVSLVGVSYGETVNVNGTHNLSQSGNGTVNGTNQSYQDPVNKSNMTNTADKTGSNGGIKEFMKSFTFQSGL